MYSIPFFCNITFSVSGTQGGDGQGRDCQGIDGQGIDGQGGDGQGRDVLGKKEQFLSIVALLYCIVI